MIEELQMVLNTIGDLGEYAVWAVVAFFLWKLITLASYLVFGKYVVSKIYDYLKKKVDDKTSTVEIGKMFITHDATPQLFVALTEEIKGLEVGASDYVHSADIQKAIEIIKEYKANNT